MIFCEDIDRAITGERSVEMDDILNILDGIDTKGNNLIQQNKAVFNEKKKPVLEKINTQLSFIK